MLKGSIYFFVLSILVSALGHIYINMEKNIDKNELVYKQSSWDMAFRNRGSFTSPMSEYKNGTLIFKADGVECVWDGVNLKAKGRRGE